MGRGEKDREAWSVRGLVFLGATFVEDREESDVDLARLDRVVEEVGLGV